MKTLQNRNDSINRTKYLKRFYPIKSQYLVTVRKKLMNQNFLSRLSLSKKLTLIFCISIIMPILFAAFPIVAASPQVQINLNTNDDSYYNMQSVGVYANMTSSGTPVYDGIMAVEVDRPTDPPGWYPILFRSVKGSQNPNPALFDNNLEILSIVPMRVGFVPVTSFKRGDTSYWNVTIRNNGLGVLGLITASLFDVASVPLHAATYGSPGSPFFIPPGITIVIFVLDIQTWSNLGTATLYANIFSESPSFHSSYAYPMCQEKSATVQIKSAYGPFVNLENYPQPESASTSTKGAYNFSWRIPPSAVLGDYTAYAAANYTSATPNSDSTIFQVTASSTPPQATFTYSPAAPYSGGTTYFDASGSFSYNGTITNYKWTWDDGTQSSTTSPYITHVFMSQRTFLVTLNVTDSQGLWCTSQKPIYVSGPTPPVASFTFSPSPTWIGASTTFDGSSSTPGWNGTGHPPIVNYAWNFGDGTPVVNEPDPITNHQFTALGNFTTTLTVTDTRPQMGQVSHVVQVIFVTEHPDIAITDVSINPPPTGLYEIAPDYYEPTKGWTGDIKVTVLNNGTSAANFSVTASYSNGTSYSLGIHNVVGLSSQSSLLLVFTWDTSLLKPTMNYTITANATILLGETNLQNNQYAITARVKGPGDANGDGYVSIGDVGLITSNWQTTVPPAPPRADLNRDGRISIGDVGLITTNWQKHY